MRYPALSKGVAVIGSGPAGLMAAHVVADSGYPVTLFEKKRGPGRKLLIAGGTGLNISNDSSMNGSYQSYKGPAGHFRTIFEAFSPKAWLDFIHHLGIMTFRGTSGRYFVEGMKASPLLRAWLKTLQNKGVKILYQQECCDFESRGGSHSNVLLHFSDGRTEEFDAVCFALGGGSHEKQEIPLRWPAFFIQKGLRFQPFRASNTGFDVDWPAGLLAEAEGQPLKNITLSSPLGSRDGDLVITRHGLEGTPIYQVGETGQVLLDLKPDLAANEINRKLRSSKENLAPIRRVKKFLRLCPAALALIFYCTPRELLMEQSNQEALVSRIKKFPITLKGRRPLSEAISSAGGLDFYELSASLMLNKFPGVFAAGEMLDWDAPTGGFLIQACAAQGFVAGKGIVEYLQTAHAPA